VPTLPQTEFLVLATEAATARAIGELIAEWEDLHHRNLMKGPGASLLFDVHYSVPEKTYQWRVQLDCGCVCDVLTRPPHRGEACR
jgi:hypothetical protein